MDSWKVYNIMVNNGIFNAIFYIKYSSDATIDYEYFKVTNITPIMENQIISENLKMIIKNSENRIIDLSKYSLTREEAQYLIIQLSESTKTQCFKSFKEKQIIHKLNELKILCL